MCNLFFRIIFEMFQPPKTVNKENSKKMSTNQENVILPEVVRLNFFKSSLNLLRSRKSTLLANQVAAVEPVVDENEISLATIHQQVDSSVAYISHLLCVKNSFDALSTGLQLKLCSDEETNKTLFKEFLKIQKICKSILAFSIDVDDSRLYQLRVKHTKKMDDLFKVINRPNNIEEANNKAIQERLKRAEYIVQKVNTTRLITQVLISVFITDREAHQDIIDNRSSFRRELTVKDFIHSGDVGF